MACISNMNQLVGNYWLVCAAAEEQSRNQRFWRKDIFQKQIIKQKLKSF